MKTVFRSTVAFAALSAMALVWTPAKSDEVTLKAIAAWPASFPLVSQGLVRFIKEANAIGKGYYKIVHIGGPEIAKAPAQPEGFKAGLYDLMFTAASYHRGIMPEVDALSGTLVRPWVARMKGGLEAFNKAASEKLNGIMISHTASSVSFILYLKDKPKRTADGGIDLTGVKMRSVPIYDSFLQALGATTVTIQVPEIYNALERGLVDGFAFPELFTRKFGWAKYVKWRVYPKFYQLEPVIFANNDSLRKLSKRGRDLLLRAGAAFEIEDDIYWRDLIVKEREILDKEYGQQEIHLTGEAARKYLELANRVPQERLLSLGTPVAKKLSEVYHHPE